MAAELRGLAAGVQHRHTAHLVLEKQVLESLPELACNGLVAVRQYLIC